MFSLPLAHLLLDTEIYREIKIKLETYGIDGSAGMSEACSIKKKHPNIEFDGLRSKSRVERVEKQL